MDVKVELNQQEADRQARALASLLVENPNTRKRLRRLIQSEIIKARTRSERDVKSAVPNDPRKAFKAVKKSVWKKALGGALHIFSSRKAGDRYELVVPRKLDRNPHQRGGNRVKRSQRTYDLQTYYGTDRGFVLRFLNSGTVPRHSRLGNRGSITARYFFGSSAGTNLDIAAEHIGKMIDQELSAIFNSEQNG